MRRMSSVDQDGTIQPQIFIRDSMHRVDVDERIAPPLNDRQRSAAIPYRLDLIDSATGKTIFQHPESRPPVGSFDHEPKTGSPVEPLPEHGGSISRDVVLIENPGSRQIHLQRRHKTI